MTSHQKIPEGVEILDLDDLLEESQLAAAAAKELSTAVARLAKFGLANTNPGSGIVLTEADVRSFVTLLDCLVERCATAHEAATTVALARLDGVR